MKRNLRLLATTLVLLLFQPLCVQAFSLVEDARPRAAIVLSGQATRCEVHAADELARYVEEMSGTKLAVLQEGQKTAPDMGLVLIGKPATHSAIQKLAQVKAIEYGPQVTGDDGFVIKTLPRSNPPTLVIAGGRDRGTLFGVYQLLHRYCRVGFFWDGERIPERKSVTLPDIDWKFKPPFKERWYNGPWSCGGPYSNANIYNFSDWKFEIDWAVKRGYNLYSQGDPISRKLIVERTREKLGWGPSAQPKITTDFFIHSHLTEGLDTPLADYQIRMNKRVFRYLRSMDLEDVTIVQDPGPLKCELTTNRPDGSGEYKFNFYLSHPHLSAWVSNYVELYNEEYGTDHRYWGLPSYAEVRFPEGKVFDYLLADASRGVVQHMKRADPRALWYVDGWTFGGYGWTKQQLRQYTEGMGSDDIRMLESWTFGQGLTDWNPRVRSGARSPHIMAKEDLFFGRPWMYTVFWNMGGQEHMVGDFPDLIPSIKWAAENADKTKCFGFRLSPEVTRYNTLIYEAFSALSWDPLGFDLDDFLLDYATCRYGEETGPAMAPVLRNVVRVVCEEGFTGFNLLPGGYQHSWGGLVPSSVYSRLGVFKETRESVRSVHGKELQGLEEAIEAMLSQSQSIPTLLANDMFCRDTLDLVRQYIACVLMNWQMVLLHEAYLDGNEQAFESGKDLNLWLLKQLEKLVSALPMYRIEWLARRFRHPDRPLTLDELRKTIRINLVHPQRGSVLDYPGKDIYEAIKFYYYPRFKWTLEMTLERLRDGKPAPEWKEVFDAIALKRRNAWVQEGYDPAEAPPYVGGTLDAVREVYDAVRSSPGVGKLRSSLGVE